MTIPQSKSYTAGHFELLIDGHKTTTYLKSVDGGWAKANVVDDPVGGETNRIKHVSSLEIDPLSVEFGLSGSAHILEWIQDSWNRKYTRRNGQISHADFNLKQTYEHWFYDALITETTFPALDGAAKDNGYLKCKLQPERVVTKKAPGPTISGDYNIKQKYWTPSAFRLTLDHIDGLEYANKIDSFTIKQGIKKFYTGTHRFPQIEPTKIEFPSISGTIALGYADGLLQWHQDYIVDGNTRDPEAQMTGALEFLSPDRASVIFRISLDQVGLANAAVMPASANADEIKRVKFELFVGTMKLEIPGALGLA